MSHFFALVNRLQRFRCSGKDRTHRPHQHIDTNYVLGLCYLDTRRYDDARKAFAAQYGFPPESPSAYLLAARMMLRRDFLPVADSFAQRALSLNPNLPLAHLLLDRSGLLMRLTKPIAEFTRESRAGSLYGEVCIDWAIPIFAKVTTARRKRPLIVPCCWNQIPRYRLFCWVRYC